LDDDAVSKRRLRVSSLVAPSPHPRYRRVLPVAERTQSPAGRLSHPKRDHRRLPHRWAVPRDTWEGLVRRGQAGERRCWSTPGLFLAEDPGMVACSRTRPPPAYGYLRYIRGMISRTMSVEGQAPPAHATSAGRTTPALLKRVLVNCRVASGPRAWRPCGPGPLGTG